MFRDRAQIELDLADLDADAALGAEEVCLGETSTAMEEPRREDSEEDGTWGFAGALAFRADGRRRDDDDGDDYYDDDYEDEDDDEDEEFDDDFEDEFEDDDDAEAFDDDE